MVSNIKYLLFFFLMGVLQSNASVYSQPSDSKTSPEYVASQQQQVVVRGKVIDEGGLPLPGVAIVLRGTTKGTSTDENGNYTIEIPSQNSILDFTFIGFAKQTINVKSQTILNVTLIEETTSLNEVVTTAHFIPREKKSLGYATQSIKGLDVTLTGETNLVHALAGKVAGVQIVGGTSGLGGSSNIIIRGNTNLSGNNIPLFVIDGVPLYNDEASTQSFWDANSAKGKIDWGDPVSKINMEDIEEISVLKGAGSTALYGSRASNGVILIKTKRGNGVKRGIGIDYSYSTAFSNPANLPEYQQEYGAGENGVYQYLGDRNNPGTNELTQNSWGPKFDANNYIPQFGSPVINGKLVAIPWISHPDNVKDFWRTGILNEHNLSLSFGDAKNYGRISVRHAGESGMSPNEDETRNSASVNFMSSLSDKWKAEMMVNYNESSSDNRNPGWGDGIIQNLMKMPSNYDMKYINSIDYKRPDGSQVKFLDFDNPYWTLNENFNKYKRYNLTANVGVRYQVTDWLEAKLSVSKNISNAEYAYFTQIDAGLTKAGAFWNNGAYAVSTDEFNEDNIDFTLFGKKQLTEDLNLSYTFGANRRKWYKNAWSSSVSELATASFANLSNGIGDKPVSQWYTQKETQSVYGMLSFGYKDFLYLDVTGRNDWSSALPKADRSYFYPSASLSFLLSEALNVKSDVLSLGKLRASWGQSGADTDPHQLQGTFGTNSVSWNGKQSTYYTSVLPPTTLRPQFTNSFEVGAELSLFKDRLNFDLAFYKTNTTDQIVKSGIPRESGFQFALLNAGNVQNKGVELMINSRILQTKDFQWNMIVNASRNENKLVTLPEEIPWIRTSWQSMEIRVVEGGLYGEMYGYSYMKNPEGRNIIMDNGKAYRSQDYPDTKWDQYIGNSSPKFLGGITNTFKYKSFRLSASLSGRFGGEVYSVSNSTNMSRGLLKETSGLNDKGIEKRLPVSAGGGMRADGVVEIKDAAGNVTGYAENEKYIESQDYYSWVAGIHEAHIFDASYIKFQDISLLYYVPLKYLKPMKVIQGISLSASMYNVAILMSHIPNVDPEASMGRNNAGLGLENGSLPAPRRVNFKINIKF